MSSEKKRGGDSAPPEARRRGGMDTLFSAPWFEQPAPGAAADLPVLEEEQPKKRNTVLLVVVGVVVLFVLPMLLCGLSVIAGAVWYAVQAGLI